jgi:Tripartite tricarboxylate transporter TctB family
MKIKSHSDFWAGLMFTVVGVVFAFGAMSYNVGSAAKMGPGYFPLMLGVLLAVLGAIVTLTALTVETPDGSPVAAFDWRSLALTLGAVCLFAFLLLKMGLVIALITLVIVSSLADHAFSWKGTLINTLILVVLCLAVFVYGLKLQFPIWPPFIG